MKNLRNNAITKKLSTLKYRFLKVIQVKRFEKKLDYFNKDMKILSHTK